MLTSFIQWLGHTPASNFIQNVSWIIPAVQTVHILAVGVVLSSVGVLGLRIFGVLEREDSILSTARRYTPWIWAALGVLAVSGAILITAEPARSLNNPAFQFKMVMLVAAIALTAAFQARVHRDLAGWAAGRTPAAPVKLLTVLTLLVWFVIPVAGRWIAYMIVDTGA